MSDLPALVEQLSSLSVMEAAELSRMLEEKWGVSASAPVAQVQQASQPVEQAAPEEQTEFSVILTGSGEKRVSVIKEVRTITGLGLKEAKDFTESAPKVLKEGVTKDEAARILKVIEDAGGKAEIK